MKVRYIIFAFIVIGLFWRTYQHQNVLFSDWDEGIYAEVASDMVEHHSYILPSFNGEPWLDKPPVTSALTAVAFQLFPHHKELASRFMMTFAAIGLLGVVYLLSRYTMMHFFSRDLENLPEWQRELILFSPVFATALTPVFLDRAVRLNTDSILALSWLCYFLSRESFKGKIASIALGTWTKSMAGFYPMMFDIVSFASAKQKTKQALWYMGLILVGLSWLILNYVAYGNAFVKAHIEDQLFKRVNVPIELHFGGRLFYPEFLFKELSFVLAIIVIAYIVIAWDIFKKLRVANWKNVFEEYKLLLSPLPFFALLTFAKSKLWWYLILIIPFFALTIPYFLMKIQQKTLRLVFAVVVCGFFLYRFLPATYLLKIAEDTPEKIRVAKCVASIESSRVLIMVNEQERKNRNVVEAAQLQTSSSFSYGGSPSFVYYSQKPVVHFYRVDELLGRLLEKEKTNDILVVSKDDMSKPEFKEISDLLQKAKRETTCYFGEWEVYHL
jgi:4-amino-4-deoxy-L-arabinose transferase-like glycosyltransferase